MESENIVSEETLRAWLVVTRKNLPPCCKGGFAMVKLHGEWKRVPLPCWSPQCLTCSLKRARRTCAALDSWPGEAYFNTLTFAVAPATQGELAAIWRDYGQKQRRNFPHLWTHTPRFRVCEYGSLRGRPHYHNLRKVPRGTGIDAVADSVEQCWVHGRSEIRYSEEPRALVHYLTGYVTAFEKKRSGYSSRSRVLQQLEKNVSPIPYELDAPAEYISEADLPRALRAMCHDQRNLQAELKESAVTGDYSTSTKLLYKNIEQWRSIDGTGEFIQ